MRSDTNITHAIISTDSPILADFFFEELPALVCKTFGCNDYSWSTDMATPNSRGLNSQTDTQSRHHNWLSAWQGRDAAGCKDIRNKVRQNHESIDHNKGTEMEKGSFRRSACSYCKRSVFSQINVSIVSGCNIRETHGRLDGALIGFPEWN